VSSAHPPSSLPDVPDPCAVLSPMRLMWLVGSIRGVPAVLAARSLSFGEQKLAKLDARIPVERLSVGRNNSTISLHHRIRLPQRERASSASPSSPSPNSALLFSARLPWVNFQRTQTPPSTCPPQPPFWPGPDANWAPEDQLQHAAA
jgi:hypothetical protein